MGPIGAMGSGNAWGMGSGAGEAGGSGHGSWALGAQAPVSMALERARIASFVSLTRSPSPTALSAAWESGDS